MDITKFGAAVNGDDEPVTNTIKGEPAVTPAKDGTKEKKEESTKEDPILVQLTIL